MHKQVAKYKIMITLLIMCIGCVVPIERDKIDTAYSEISQNNHRLTELRLFIMTKIENPDLRQKIIERIDNIIKSNNKVFEILMDIKNQLEESEPLIETKDLIHIINTAINKYK